MNWYIGQPIVAIRNSVYGGIKKGQEFNILGLRSGTCKCYDVEIDVGILDTDIADIETCSTCGAENICRDNIMWKDDRLFAPLDQDISELTEILTKKQPFEI